MLVHVEAAGPGLVRAHSPLGDAVVRWSGEGVPSGSHPVEWTVDEDIAWGVNTRAASRPEPAFWQEEGRVVLRGRLRVLDATSAGLRLGDASILLDLAGPVPGGVDWVEVRVARHGVSLWPYSL